MTTLVMDHGAATDVGLVRAINEDALLVAPPVFVVADGMGGHDGGDVASNIVVTEFGALGDARFDRTSGRAAIEAALNRSQERISTYALEQRAGGLPHFQSGTTCVAALLVEEDERSAWLLANLGDSRIYRWDAGELVQISRDHSLVQEMVDAGTLTPEDARRHPERNVITRALGGMSAAEADYFEVDAQPGSVLVLCSDGVSGMLGDAEIARILGEGADAQDTAERLVDVAVAAGGHDNATAVVVHVVGWNEENPYDSAEQAPSLT